MYSEKYKQVGRAYNLTKIQTKMILVEEEYGRRPEGNEGIRGSHVDVNYDITAENNIIS